MKLNAYTIFDVASGTYMRPFFCGADGEATRGFNDIALDANHEVGKHPQDYTLYRMGSFNRQLWEKLKAANGYTDQELAEVLNNFKP